MVLCQGREMHIAPLRRRRQHVVSAGRGGLVYEVVGVCVSPISGFQEIEFRKSADG